MGKKKIDYTCPRCDYTTNDRSHMRYHLYNKKKPCPCTNQNIELTDEIKEFILANKIYKPPPVTKESMQPVVNNTMINNIICNVDMLPKIKALCKHKNARIRAVDSTIEALYEDQVKLMDEPRCNLALTKEDMLATVHDVTKVKGNEIIDYNVLYDKSSKQFYVNFPSWTDMPIDEAAKTVLEQIFDRYWKFYECYLIRKHISPDYSAREKSSIREHIDTYYKFLASCSIPPYVQGRDDNEIKYINDDDLFYEESGSTELSERYMSIYNQLKNELTGREIQNVRTHIHTTMKNNGHNTAVSMNKLIKKLIQMDENFKTEMNTLMIEL